MKSNEWPKLNITQLSFPNMTRQSISPNNQSSRNQAIKDDNTFYQRQKTHFSQNVQKCSSANSMRQGFEQQKVQKIQGVKGVHIDLKQRESPPPSVVQPSTTVNIPTIKQQHEHTVHVHINSPHSSILKLDRHGTMINSAAEPNDLKQDIKISDEGDPNGNGLPSTQQISPIKGVQTGEQHVFSFRPINQDNTEETTKENNVFEDTFQRLEDQAKGDPQQFSRADLSIEESKLPSSVTGKIYMSGGSQNHLDPLNLQQSPKYKMESVQSAAKSHFRSDEEEFRISSSKLNPFKSSGQMHPPDEGMQYYLPTNSDLNRVANAENVCSKTNLKSVVHGSSYSNNSSYVFKQKYQSTDKIPILNFSVKIHNRNQKEEENKLAQANSKVIDAATNLWKQADSGQRIQNEVAEMMKIGDCGTINIDLGQLDSSVRTSERVKAALLQRKIAIKQCQYVQDLNHQANITFHSTQTHWGCGSPCNNKWNRVGKAVKTPQCHSLQGQIFKQKVLQRYAFQNKKSMSLPRRCSDDPTSVGSFSTSKMVSVLKNANLMANSQNTSPLHQPENIQTLIEKLKKVKPRKKSQQPCSSIKKDLYRSQEGFGKPELLTNKEKKMNKTFTLFAPQVKDMSPTSKKPMTDLQSVKSSVTANKRDASSNIELHSLKNSDRNEKLSAFPQIEATHEEELQRYRRPARQLHKKKNYMHLLRSEHTSPLTKLKPQERASRQKTSAFSQTDIEPKEFVQSLHSHPKKVHPQIINPSDQVYNYFFSANNKKEEPLHRQYQTKSLIKKEQQLSSLIKQLRLSKGSALSQVDRDSDELNLERHYILKNEKLSKRQSCSTALVQTSENDDLAAEQSLINKFIQQESKLPYDMTFVKTLNKEHRMSQEVAKKLSQNISDENSQISQQIDEQGEEIISPDRPNISIQEANFSRQTTNGQLEKQLYDIILLNNHGELETKKKEGLSRQSQSVMSQDGTLSENRPTKTGGTNISVMGEKKLQDDLLQQIGMQGYEKKQETEAALLHGQVELLSEGYSGTSTPYQNFLHEQRKSHGCRQYNGAQKQIHSNQKVIKGGGFSGFKQGVRGNSFKNGQLTQMNSTLKRVRLQTPIQGNISATENIDSLLGADGQVEERTEYSIQQTLQKSSPENKNQHSNCKMRTDISASKISNDGKLQEVSQKSKDTPKRGDSLNFKGQGQSVQHSESIDQIEKDARQNHLLIVNQNLVKEGKAAQKIGDVQEETLFENSSRVFFDDRKEFKSKGLTSRNEEDVRKKLMSNSQALVVTENGSQDWGHNASFLIEEERKRKESCSDEVGSQEILEAPQFGEPATLNKTKPVEYINQERWVDFSPNYECILSSRRAEREGILQLIRNSAQKKPEWTAESRLTQNINMNQQLMSELTDHSTLRQLSHKNKILGMALHESSLHRSCNHSILSSIHSVKDQTTQEEGKKGSNDLFSTSHMQESDDKQFKAVDDHNRLNNQDSVKKSPDPSISQKILRMTKEGEVMLNKFQDQCKMQINPNSSNITVSKDRNMIEKQIQCSSSLSDKDRPSILDQKLEKDHDKLTDSQINIIKYLSPRNNFFHEPKKSQAEIEQEQLNNLYRQEYTQQLILQQQRESQLFYSKLQQSTGEHIRIIGDPLPKMKKQRVKSAKKISQEQQTQSFGITSHTQSNYKKSAMGCSRASSQLQSGLNPPSAHNLSREQSSVFSPFYRATQPSPPLGELQYQNNTAKIMVPFYQKEIKDWSNQISEKNSNTAGFPTGNNATKRNSINTSVVEQHKDKPEFPFQNHQLQNAKQHPREVQVEVSTLDQILDAYWLKTESNAANEMQIGRIQCLYSNVPTSQSKVSELPLSKLAKFKDESSCLSHGGASANLLSLLSPQTNKKGGVTLAQATNWSSSLERDRVQYQHFGQTFGASRPSRSKPGYKQ